MSEAPTDAEETDEDLGPAIPEPPRRVPFGVAVTAALLGFIALLLMLGALLTLTANTLYEDSAGEAAGKGLAGAALAVGGAVVAAVAWSFVRNGNTVGPMVTGGLILLAGLAFLANGITAESNGSDAQVGVLALVVGLGVLLVPLLGHGPSYLAVRRVWAKAESEWLRDLSAPAAPPPMPYQQPQQWPGQHPGYPQQYQYPPQQPWGPQQQQQQWGPPPQPQYQAWPTPPVSQQAPTEQVVPPPQQQ